MQTLLKADQQSVDRQRANTFPMTIELMDNQDKTVILERLAPGMQVSANIIVRQRPVITLLTDVSRRVLKVCKTAVDPYITYSNSLYCIQFCYVDLRYVKK